jgi:hypothetical protein
MAAEMRVAYAERMREIAARAETLPHEIQELMLASHVCANV